MFVQSMHEEKPSNALMAIVHDAFAESLAYTIYEMTCRHLIPVRIRGKAGSLRRCCKRRASSMVFSHFEEMGLYRFK